MHLLPLATLWTYTSAPVDFFSPWYLLLSAGISTSNSGLLLLGNHHYADLAATACLYHRTLALLFSTTFRGISHQGLGIPSPCVYFPVHYPSLLVGPVSLCCPSLALRSCYYELDSLLGAFIHSATWILSVSVDSCFYGPGAQGLCCFLTWPFVAIGRISLCQPVPLSLDGTAQGWTWLSVTVAV